MLVLLCAGACALFPDVGPLAKNTALTAPTSFVVTGATATSIAVAWQPSTDDVAVTGYTIFVEGVARATTPSTAIVVSALACGATAHLAVDAFDAAGHHSPQAELEASTTACGAPDAPADVTSGPSASRLLVWAGYQALSEDWATWNARGWGGAIVSIG